MSCADDGGASGESGGQDGTAGSSSTGGGGGDKLPSSAKKLIGEEGGTLKVDGAQLFVPPGALNSPVELDLSRLSDALPTLPGEASSRSPSFAFQPHGQIFQLPAEIEIDFTTPTGVPVVARLDDEVDTTWERAAPDAEFTDGRAAFSVSSFSVYQIADDSAGDLGGAGSSGPFSGTSPVGSGVCSGPDSPMLDPALDLTDAEISQEGSTITVQVSVDGDLEMWAGMSADPIPVAVQFRMSAGGPYPEAFFQAGNSPKGSNGLTFAEYQLAQNLLTMTLTGIELFNVIGIQVSTYDFFGGTSNLCEDSIIIGDYE